MILITYTWLLARRTDRLQLSRTMLCPPAMASLFLGAFILFIRFFIDICSFCLDNWLPFCRRIPDSTYAHTFFLFVYTFQYLSSLFGHLTYHTITLTCSILLIIYRICQVWHALWVFNRTFCTYRVIRNRKDPSSIEIRFFPERRL